MRVVHQRFPGCGHGGGRTGAVGQRVVESVGKELSAGPGERVRQKGHLGHSALRQRGSRPTAVLRSGARQQRRRYASRIQDPGQILDGHWAAVQVEALGANIEAIQMDKVVVSRQPLQMGLVKACRDTG